MIEQSKLLECMEEMKAIAVSQQGKLSQEETKKYLSGMELDEKQMKAVYQYLSMNQIVVEGYEGYMEPADPKDSQDVVDKPERQAQSKKEKLTKAQRNLKMYRQEVQLLEELVPEQERALFCRFLKGENEVRNEIMQGYLELVLQIADEYKERNVLMEEIIAEGNMGLLNAMTVLEQGNDSFLLDNNLPDMDKIKAVIEMEIRQAMETMIDGMTEEKGWEDALVAKINLLHEAAKHLAQEFGRTATEQELAEYTKLTMQEIQDILDLSEDTKKSIL